MQRAPSLTFNRKDNLQKAWILEHTGHRITPRSHFLPSTQAFIDAAAAGIGWGMNPESLARPALDDGRLCVIAQDAPLDVPLSWQVGRILAPALAPLTRAVRAAAARHLIRP